MPSWPEASVEPERNCKGPRRLGAAGTTEDNQRQIPQSRKTKAGAWEPGGRTSGGSQHPWPVTSHGSSETHQHVPIPCTPILQKSGQSGSQDAPPEASRPQQVGGGEWPLHLLLTRELGPNPKAPLSKSSPLSVGWDSPSPTPTLSPCARQPCPVLEVDPCCAPLSVSGSPKFWSWLGWGFVSALLSLCAWDWSLHSAEYHADEPPKVTGSGQFCLMRSSGKLGFYVFL